MSYWYRLCLAVLLAAGLLFPSKVFAQTLVKGRAYVQTANDTYIILTFQCTGDLTGTGGSFTGDLDYELDGVDNLARNLTGSCAVPNSDGTLSLNASAPVFTTGTLTLTLTGVKSHGKTYTTDTTSCATATTACIQMQIKETTNGALNFPPTEQPGPVFGTTTLNTH